ncbi:MAG: hypothetical protein KJO05_02620 [Bacteroidia bacterium]|nr:hypothetical protein [Bacteroidia bacterium]NNF32319.1 hypothetical protein [Flavobacteriaceae bacterium]MBT8276119.1 hypothetical protein [Bacteroidia bacterium]NNJ81986.1 hypothetical protein [Flavobacteriaceae bacterium]NNK53945.1 hypothetical protein [Flavobacteriaceae bacterium]
MKRLIYIVTIVFFSASLASCGTTVSTIQKEEKVAGYTLKNKKELMQQKILNQKKKTVIAQP